MGQLRVGSGARMRKVRKTEFVTLKDILRAKKMLDAQPIPRSDRVYWDGKIGTFVGFTFYNGKKKK